MNPLKLPFPPFCNYYKSIFTIVFMILQWLQNHIYYTIYHFVMVT